MSVESNDPSENPSIGNFQTENLKTPLPPPEVSDPSSSGGTATSQTTGSSEPIDLTTFLRMSIAQGISDIHLRPGLPPTVRKDGLILATRFPPLTPEDITRFARELMTEKQFHELQNSMDYDFGLNFENIARFRVNFFRVLGDLGMVLRLIPIRIPSIEDLGLPQVLKRFADLNKGLVLVTGPTGSGKTTTLATILNYINLTYAKHIITLEDPIEFVYKSERSVVTQRQIGLDTDSFPSGIKYALRQDPDVILIGEMRDRETMMSAINASETGHLVFSTLHTNDAVQTINRVINAFEPHERDPVRRQLSDVLQGTVSQRLVRKAEGKGRIAIAEIMMVTPAIEDYIYKNEIDQIYELMKIGDYEGMCSLNHALYRAYRNNFITSDEALRVSDKPAEMQQLLRGAYHGVS